MNPSGLLRLLNSSKGLVFLGIVTAGMVLVLTGHLRGEDVYERIIHLAMVYFPAVAIEDASKNIAARPPAAGVQQNVNMPTSVAPPPLVQTPIRIVTKEEE